MVPASVICVLLGVPITDVGRFHTWSNAIFADWSRPRDEIDEAYAAMSRYMSELITQKRKAPEDDLLRYVIISGSGFVPLARITREEVCLGGVTIPAGETVLPSFNTANRDPAAFDDPDRLDVRRAPKTHLGFGAGVHHCLGAQLARMELQEAFRGLLTRLPGLRVTVPMSELEFRAGQAIASVRELPVTWDDS
jgi:cytochrome P450